ncbi:MAG: flagellar cap protein FliD N-terminal domain-containing protein [Dehalococcoidia bacterium]
MVNSVSASRKPIVFGGLVSGLDTANIIQQLVAAKRGPIQLMQGRVATVRQQSNAVRDVGSRLSNLLTQVKNFADSTYVQGKSAAVSPAGATATVSASASTATVGGFKVTVEQLADATRVSSPTAISAAIDANALLKDAALATTVTAGTFTVNGVQISVDPTTDSLNAVMQRIRDNVAGVTVGLVADGSGRNNLLQINHAGGVTPRYGRRYEQLSHRHAPVIAVEASAARRIVWPQASPRQGRC